PQTARKSTHCEIQGQLHCQAGERACSLRAGFKTKRSVAELCQGLETGSNVEEVNASLGCRSSGAPAHPHLFRSCPSTSMTCRKTGVRCMLVGIRGRSRGR